jgi:hypothetical protein
MTAHNIHELATFRLCEDLMKKLQELQRGTSRRISDSAIRSMTQRSMRRPMSPKGLHGTTQVHSRDFSTTPSHRSPRCARRPRRATDATTFPRKPRATYSNCARGPTRRHAGFARTCGRSRRPIYRPAQTALKPQRSQRASESGDERRSPKRTHVKNRRELARNPHACS